MSDVTSISATCAAGMASRKLERALMGGTNEMRAQGESFTPRYDGEDVESYKIRLNCTFLFNAFAEAVRSSAGKVLSRDVILNDDVPGEIAALAPNIDGQGRNLTAFALDAFVDAMSDGLSFIFVDFPEILGQFDKPPLLSDQIAQNARPYAILYKADQIIGFKHANIEGFEQPTQIRIHEIVTEPSGDWGEIQIEQIRVLNRGSFELWRENDKDEWVMFKEGRTSLTYIPIVPFYTHRTGFMTGTPPLKSLAELNLEHWISSSDQRKALTFARFAMMVFTGVQTGAIQKVGPDVVVELAEPNAKWGKIESSGSGIADGRLDLEALENKMQHAGMTINIQDAQGNITAMAAAINSDDVNAPLMALAGALEDTLDQMLQIFADYLGLPDGGSATVNKQFGRRKSTATVQDFILLGNAGYLDGQTILTELKQRGDLSEDLDLEEVARRIRETPPNLLG